MESVNKAVSSRHGKKYRAAAGKVQSGKKYALDEAIALLKEISFAKFDESTEVAFRLGVDPKHADQMVRGALVLPHGTGKSARILVVAKGERAKEAELAGADFVGAEELLEKIAGGWTDFDRMIATPDMMVAISKVGKILGPKGLMPNPKLGTVTMDVAKAVQDQKKGKVEYRAEKTGIVHVVFGKKSFDSKNLRENFIALLQAIMKAKPPTSKGTYLRSVTFSTTMSPAVLVDETQLFGLGQ